jgi:hypothetical protein
MADQIGRAISERERTQLDPARKAAAGLGRGPVAQASVVLVSAMGQAFNRIKDKLIEALDYLGPESHQPTYARIYRAYVKAKEAFENFLKLITDKSEQMRLRLAIPTSLRK